MSSRFPARVAAGGLLALALVVGLAGAASAQVTAIGSQTVNGYVFHDQGGANGNSNSFTDAGNSAAQYGYEPSAASYANYQVSTNIDNLAGKVDFANNVTAMGFASYVSTQTKVVVSYTNTSDNAVIPKLLSTITPAGLGMYVADLTHNPTTVLASPGNIYDGTVADINQTPELKNSPFYLADYGYPIYQFANPGVGQAGVSFQILDGATVVAEFHAYLTLYLTYNGNRLQDPADPFAAPNGSIAVLDTGSSPGLTLNGFGPPIAADDPQSAVGYRWDATELPLTLAELGAHQTGTLTYISTAFAHTTMQTNGLERSLLAYAGFGDPIGQDAGAGGIDDPIFPLLQLSLPTFDPVTGALAGPSFQGYEAPLLLTVYDQTNDADHPPKTYQPPFVLPESARDVGGVPEPSTWSLMLGGFGLAGAALRRRAHLA